MSEIKFMQRALELARLGIGKVSPNPMVGCVIVHDGKIIGEGYHQKYGKAHAEVNAVNAVINKDLLKESSVYVSLEPCNHFGKTPPCTDLLVERKVKKVIVACSDPFEKVNGKGIEKMKRAGIEVATGMLEKEAVDLNKRFFTFHQKKRPYVILKWAQTEDGYLAGKNGDSRWISNSYSRQLVHKWRTEEDAILVGKNTALNDNPSLTVRDWHGENPVRILLDSNLEIPASYHLFNKDAKTLILNKRRDDNQGSNYWVKISSLNARVVLKVLYQHNIQSIIVEGGAQVLNSFIQENCWDEARIFYAKTTFGDGISAPDLTGDMIANKMIQNDQLSIYQNNG